MLVEERMSAPVISTSPDTPILDALQMMQEQDIRRMPVMKDGKLMGIISDRDLLNASPSGATSLSVWEINYLMSRIKVADVMTSDVMTVDHDTPIEEAARMMADNKIGGLPVTRNGRVIGIITETDLFKILLELMGARENGVRLTAVVEDRPGELAALTEAITGAGGSFVSFGQFAGDDTDTRIVTFKVVGVEEAEARAAIEHLVSHVSDVRRSG